jgi:hypothetical protein
MFAGLVFVGTVCSQDQAGNAKAVETLRRVLDNDYSHRDRLKIDWKNRFEEFEPKFLAAADKDQFAKIAVEFLSVARSAGSSGNPKPHDLGNGLVLMLPSWRDLSREGKGLEGVGVEPDITVETTPATFTKSDPVLAKALEHLRSKSSK